MYRKTTGKNINKDINGMLTWGQYLHWSDILFERWMISEEQTDDLEPAIPEAVRRAFGAQWFASLYVVIEGWRTVNHQDDLMDALIDKYPDYCRLLRKFRNSMYHFQPQILDFKIRDFAKQGEELLNWSVALHFEFQRYLWEWPEKIGGTESQREEFRELMRKCIQWLPSNNISIKKREIAKLCKDTVQMVENDKQQSSAHSVELLNTVFKAKQMSDGINDNPLLGLLSRLITSKQEEMLPNNSFEPTLENTTD